MRISVIIGHPDPGSFNHAIAEAAVDALEKNGHLVSYHDLYREEFDPILTGPEIPRGGAVDPAVESHCAEIAGADGIIIVHPNWWGQPPAILKGWVDRVMRPGVAYQFLEGDGGEGVPVGLLKARSALIFNTSNTPKEREMEAFGDPLDGLWKRCVFGLCGVSEVRRRTFSVVVTSTPEERRAWLVEVEDIVGSLYPPETGGEPLRQPAPGRDPPPTGSRGVAGARIGVVLGDITEMEVDAIVNAANPTLLGGGGVDGAIHEAAGPRLLEECRTLGGCPPGEARITKGYRLPAKFVIHTVGPVWHGGGRGEDGLLARAYSSSLSLAAERGAKTIAFPSISTGAYGFPLDRAARVAVGEIKRFLETNDTIEDVTIVCFSEKARGCYREALEKMG
ncbi:MAG: 2'-O-acetyl-ADP-ribose deacetylase, regulator of RNase III activity (modular protein) [Methanothrix sp.]|jgi:O-acetyl-ADP-ribose deacetylase (regulator of RNase III)/putative NADPH-quinone reductase|nr:MAG: 2'-O-acetyl-ADP-ribose deacetylase, regulator of RNase III activity (modular protein) [Methanothrix sp.]